MTGHERRSRAPRRLNWEYELESIEGARRCATVFGIRAREACRRPAARCECNARASHQGGDASPSQACSQVRHRPGLWAAPGGGGAATGDRTSKTGHEGADQAARAGAGIESLCFRTRGGHFYCALPPEISIALRHCPGGCAYATDFRTRTCGSSGHQVVMAVPGKLPCSRRRVGCPAASCGFRGGGPRSRSPTPT